MTTILCVAGPTASGKSGRAVTEALARNGEVISVDARQVYRGLDIGTEKITQEEMRGVPHHLIDICDPQERYSAGDFVRDAHTAIGDIRARGKLPILAGGTHFYFDALFKGLPESAPPNLPFRASLASVPTAELYARIEAQAPERARQLDPQNRTRLIRTLELLEQFGTMPKRAPAAATQLHADWIILNPPAQELRARIAARLAQALERGLVAETEWALKTLGAARVEELGMEYRVVAAYLRGELPHEALLPTLTARVAQYARRQRAWLRKLADEQIVTEVV